MDARVTVPKVSGVEVTGEVIIRDSGEQIATATLDDRGRVSVDLGDLDRGFHWITVEYAGTDLIASSTSWRFEPILLHLGSDLLGETMLPLPALETRVIRTHMLPSTQRIS